MEIFYRIVITMHLPLFSYYLFYNPSRFKMDIGNAEIMMTEALVYILYISSRNRTCTTYTFLKIRYLYS